MVDKLYCSVAHEHKKRFLTSPTDHPTIKLLMKSIRRHLARPRQPVQPIEPAHLLQINRHLKQQGDSANLELWRTVWRTNLQYYSACRFSEINQLSTSDVQIRPPPNSCLVIQIRCSKTDQFREGLEKFVFPVTSEPLLCPVRLTQLYLKRLGQHLPSGKTYQGFLQPRVRYEKSLKQQIPLASQQIGYSSCLDETRQLLQLLQIPGRFGEHSGRRGAATQAALNGGSLLEVQTLGNWKSGSTAQKYVDLNARQKESLSRLLLPS